MARRTLDNPATTKGVVVAVSFPAPIVDDAVVLAEVVAVLEDKALVTKPVDVIVTSEVEEPEVEVTGRTV